MRAIENQGKVLQQFPFHHNNIRMQVREVDHTKENQKCGLLEIIDMLNFIDSRGLIDTHPPHLIVLHDQMRNVALPITNEREEKESHLAKLEQLVILIHATNTVNEKGLVGSEHLRALIVTGPEA